MKWEYLMVETTQDGTFGNIIPKLNELGQQGWRAVPVNISPIPGILMEREIPEPTESSRRHEPEELRSIQGDNWG